MKICWDNLNKLRYNLENGLWYDIRYKGGVRYKYVESCKECGESFLSQIQAKTIYCSYICAGKERARYNFPDHKGENNPMYGRTHTITARKKIAEGQIGKCELDKHPNWKGGIKLARGYRMVKMPSHPKSNGYGYVMEHRIVMEQFLGRYLSSDEEVHHKNGIKDDNRIDNLELWGKGHQGGQRIDDLIDFSIEILKRYRPDLLKSGVCDL